MFKVKMHIKMVYCKIIIKKKKCIRKVIRTRNVYLLERLCLIYVTIAISIKIFKSLRVI